MPTIYPAQIDNDTSLPKVIDNVTTFRASVVNILRDTIIEIESELGIKPSGIYGTVRARLDSLENAIVNPLPSENISFGGDLRGTQVSQVVIGIQGYPVLASGPLTGQVLEWSGSQWVPTTPASQFTAGGDLLGSNTSQIVSGFYNHPLASTTPVNSAVPVWDSSIYDIRQLTQDDILPGFSVTGFSGGSTVEIGSSVVNPVFSVSYSHTPVSAQITNTDNIDSPLALSSLFTSGTVVGSFQHTSATTVTFTLTAIYTSTQSKTQTINYQARSFGGVGTAGATSSVSASGTTAILSTSDVLASVGLHTSDVGNTYGPFTPVGQKMYLLLVGGSHVLKDPNTNTIIPITVAGPTAVSFTNINGSVVSMFLYETLNTVTGTFSIQVSS